MTRWCPEQRSAAFGEPRSRRERQSHQRGGRRFAWCPGSSGCRASPTGGAASAFALALLCGLRRGPTPGLGESALGIALSSAHSAPTLKHQSRSGMYS